MNPAYCDDGKNIDIVPIFGFKYGHTTEFYHGCIAIWHHAACCV